MITAGGAGEKRDKAKQVRVGRYEGKKKKGTNAKRRMGRMRPPPFGREPLDGLSY